MRDSQVIDMSGERHGRLTVLSFAFSKNKNAHWLVRCDCGVEKIMLRSNIKRSYSCGNCCRGEWVKKYYALGGESPVIKHGECRKSIRSKEYHAYYYMLNRCYKPGNISYKYYGGRGITVCDRWRGPDGFPNFLADMGRAPTLQHSLDRKYVNGHYEPDNCRWATKKEQANNTRRQLC